MEKKEKLARKIAKAIMMERKKISTDFGVKTEEGLAQMILMNSPKEVAIAIMNEKDKIKTSYGVKTQEGIVNLILQTLEG